MKSRILLLISGGLLLVLGILSTINNFPLISGEDAQEYSLLFRISLYAIPGCFLISGIMGILSCIFNNKDSFSFKLTKFVGLKLALLPLVLFASAYITENLEIINKFCNILFDGKNIRNTYINPRLLFSNSIISAKYFINYYIVLFAVIAVIVHFYLTGIEFTEQVRDDWTAYYNTRWITRLIAILVLCGIPFFGYKVFETHEKMTMLIFASYLCWGMTVFSFIRCLSISKSIEYRSVKICFLTIGSIIAFILYIGIISLFGGAYSWFGNLSIYIPVVLLALGLILLRTPYAVIGVGIITIIPIVIFAIVLMFLKDFVKSSSKYSIWEHLQMAESGENGLVSYENRNGEMVKVITRRS